MVRLVAHSPRYDPSGDDVAHGHDHSTLSLSLRTRDVLGSPRSSLATRSLLVRVPATQMNVAALSALRRATGTKAGSSDDLSRTVVDDGHTLPHVILRLELVNFPFGECAVSPEERRLTVGMYGRVSRIQLRTQCVWKNTFVLRYSQDAHYVAASWQG